MGQDQLQFYNENYPCSKRVGYGFEGCQCKGNTRPSQQFFQCALYDNITLMRCRDCIHQYKEVTGQIPK
jgi:hypothetical protein